MNYLIHIATLFLLYLLLVESMNLYLGYTGILALSHIAFMGLGGYTGAIITLNGGSFWTGFFLGGLFSLILGCLLGLTSLRLRADYLGIATLGFTQILSSIFQNWSEVTRGPLGLPGIPRPSLFGFPLTEKFHYFLFVLAITAVLMFLMHRLVKSPFGRVLETIRDDEIGAKMLGKNTLAYKLAIFSLGSMIAGFAGVLYAHFITFINPSSFTLEEMGTVLVMLMIGGLGTFRGPFYGVGVILFLQEGVRFLHLPAQVVGPLQLLLYSLLFLIVMMYFPQGIGGFLKHRHRRRKQLMNY